MMRRTLAYLLMLLLAVAALDGACAAATPDTADDVAAAENDEYLPSASRPDGPLNDARDLPPSPTAAEGGPRAARVAPAVSSPDPHAGPSLLYVFMSLRR